MKAILSSIKEHLNFSNVWVRNGVILIMLSIVLNHLNDPKNFPLNENYRFPWFPILVSIISGIVVLVIATYNFNYYKVKYFTRKINTAILLRFLFSSLGYICLLYFLLYFGLNGLINGTDSYSIYHLFHGLLISLLSSAMVISLFFAKDIYKLHKQTASTSSLKVKQGGKITVVNHIEISYIYNENKIVYIVITDGSSVCTDFTLNEIEELLKEYNFFRANRQTILHTNSVAQIKAIENGKLLVQLKPIRVGSKTFEINISRYKKQAFMEWFEKTG